MCSIDERRKERVIARALMLRHSNADSLSELLSVFSLDRPYESRPLTIELLVDVHRPDNSLERLPSYGRLEMLRSRIADKVGWIHAGGFCEELDAKSRSKMK